jgi:hypothetical protein
MRSVIGARRGALEPWLILGPPRNRLSRGWFWRKAGGARRPDASSGEGARALGGRRAAVEAAT